MASEKAAQVADILGNWDWAGSDIEVIEHTDDHRYIIGLDPGGTTGVAILRVNPKDPKELPALILLDQVEDGLHGFADYFDQFGLDEKAELVSEQWVERNIKGADRTPIYIEGAMHMLWGDYNVNWQEPAMKDLIGDDFLKEQGLWVEGKRHEMDALIHCLVFLRNEEHPGTIAALTGNAEGTIAEPGDTEAAQGDGESPSQEDGAERSLAQWAREVSSEEEEHHNGSADTNEEEKNHEQEQAEGYEKKEPKGKRKERDLGGAFIGFASEEEESGEEVSLFDE